MPLVYKSYVKQNEMKDEMPDLTLSANKHKC